MTYKLRIQIQTRRLKVNKNLKEAISGCKTEPRSILRKLVKQNWRNKGSLLSSNIQNFFILAYFNCHVP